MDAITFEQLPQAVTRLILKLEDLEKLLLTKSNLPQPETDELLTVKQAADFLRLSVGTIYGMISQEKIPCMKRSKRVYFSKLELTNYLKEGRKATTVIIDAETDAYLNNFKKRRA